MGRTNQIKKGGGDELRLQITGPARDAGLVLEDSEGNATELASVYVYSFDGLVLVVSQSVDMGYRAGLVASAAGDTESMFGGYPATVAQAGNGYQVNLPGASEAGFRVGDNAPVVSAPDMLAIHDGTQSRVADDLATIRREQG